MNKETGKRTTTEKVSHEMPKMLRLDDTEWRKRKGMRIRQKINSMLIITMRKREEKRSRDGRMN